MRHFLVLSLATLVTAVSVVGVRADNQATAEIIANSLSEEFPDADITVRFQDGRVWLQGELTSRSEMLKAVKLVSSIEGVKTVANEMEVLSADTSELDALPSLMKEEFPIAQKPTNGQTAPMPLSVMTAGGAGYDNEINQVANHRIIRTLPPSVPQVQGATRIHAQPIQHAIPGSVRPKTIETTDTEISGSIISSDDTDAPVIIQGTNAGRQPALSMRDRAPMQVRPQYNTRGPSDYISGDVVYSGAYPAAPANGAFVGGTQPNLPPYAWPSYAAHPNYAQVTYPKKYDACAWPNIGPFYPYPQPPLGWRKVTMEWHDGNWFMDFDDGSTKGPFSPLFRQPQRYTY